YSSKFPTSSLGVYLMNSPIRTLSVSLLIILSSIAAAAQKLQTVSATGNKYLISAKAGGVNLVEGNVSISRSTGRSGILLVKDEIAIGERVTTPSNGRAEVLLNPGSYLRVGPETSFDFVSTSLDDLQLNIYRGSAIFEVIADEEFSVLIKTPGNEVKLTRSGVYRVDVLPDTDVRVSVVKGKLFVGPDSKTKVKAGRTVLIKGEETTVAKFDKDADDPLDMWSQSRAKDLAKANAGLQRNALRSTLVSSF